MSCVAYVVWRDRKFGGGEEGGWWYDTFSPSYNPCHLQHLRGFSEQEIADGKLDEYLAELRKVLKEQNAEEHNLDPSSVLSNGMWDIYVYEDEFPHYIPTEQPHYE